MATKVQLEERVAGLEAQVAREEKARARRVLKVLKVARENEWCEQVFEALKVAGEKLPDIYWVEEQGERYERERGRYVQVWSRNNCEWALTEREAVEIAQGLNNHRSTRVYSTRVYFQPAKGRGKVVWTEDE